MKKSLLLICFFGLATGACGLFDDENALPFDRSVVSVGVLVDDMTAGTPVATEWHYWFTFNANDDDDIYRYSNLYRGFDGEFSDSCIIDGNLSDEVFYLSYSCTVGRLGFINPNKLNWITDLTYEVLIEADMENMVVSKAKISFPDYGRSFDFTQRTKFIVYDSFIRFWFYADSESDNTSFFNLQFNVDHYLITDPDAYFGPAE